jgi:hypothetical protein
MSVMAEATTIRPFKVEVPEEQLADLRRRIDATRWPSEQLDDRPGPAVRHDERQRIVMPRPDVDEVDLDAVDLGGELGERIQSRLAPAQVVLARPVAGEGLHRRQLHPLGPVCNELRGRPTCRLDASAKVVEPLLRELDAVRP